MDTATLRPLRGGRPHSSGWKRALGTLGGAFLGLIFLVAAWAKLLDPDAFAEQITAEGLDFLLSASAVALIALALEVGLGSALVLGIRRWWILIPSALLVAFFIFLTGRTYWKDSQGLLEEGTACGCFGNLVERTPAEAFWQDLLLLVPPLILAFLWRRGSRTEFPTVRSVLVGVMTVASLLFAIKAPELPLDDLATRLKPGISVTELCTGKGDERVCLDTLIPGVEDGEHLIVLADLEDETFGESVSTLNEFLFSDAGPRLSVATASEPEQKQAFFWARGPSFEIHEIPLPLMAQLNRTLPRSFLVEGGTVRQTFAGLPPFERWASPEPS